MMHLLQRVLPALIGCILALTVSANPAKEIPADFFAVNEPQLGRDAQKSDVDGGVLRLAGGDNYTSDLSAAWSLERVLTPGVTYLVTGKVRIVDATTGEPAKGRVLVRFGSSMELTGLHGQTAATLFDRPITEPTEFAGHTTFKTTQPFFGFLGLGLGKGSRVEISDLSIRADTPPWSIIPDKELKILLINDVPIARNSMRDGSIPIPPGARQVHVKVTYALPEILSTTVVRARTSSSNARGFDPNRDVRAPDRAYFWRDGDDRDHWITFDILNPSIKVGDRFRASVSGSGIAGWAGFDFEVTAGAINQLPAKLPYHRPPYRLALPAEPTVRLDMTTVEWSESGFKDERPVWRTRPSHGYTQSGNGETGAYLPWTEKNLPGDAPQSLQVDAEGRPYVRLHTRKLDTPIDLGKGRSLPHQASMLQAQQLDEWCHRRGIFSAQLLLPDRRGAWSAFWSVGRRDRDRASMWPPEVDFLESFNGAYGADYRPDTTSAGQHAGPHGTGKRESIDGFQFDVVDAGFAKDLNFFTQIHHYTTLIEDEWITHFRDGVEFLRQRNIVEPSDGNTDWKLYPILNVAVKAGSDGPYDEGSGDMRWYGLQYYAPDSGYSLVPFNEPPPYKNRELLPRPKM